ncbi:EAL domain-containing protein [Spirulina subsalsa FACHB-351]|uniref:EAL domain-containing protein n=1 Tax=Spirulina subsalsa FACHB-351 TaxID=234711 RepID=A0ABT3L1E6_9CYAN|nr:bifunctional diguanylate cyclase/phosphodiesterase [Spirulina subsalsa]MCW6035037.1 EAL domain-containing protein [Spirulina subsalsa FACHB-351]
MTTQTPGRKIPKLQVYSFLARLKLPQSYLGKIMLVAFIGTHIPLLTLFFYAIASANIDLEIKVRILVVALIATLIGTGITLFTLQQLLSPIRATFLSLRHYLEKSVLPNLPTEFKDEVGILMSDTMYAIAKLDESIHQLKNYDPLTALPNRDFLQYRLEEAIALAQREHTILAILLLDIKDFSSYNNSLGQDKGDWLLRQIARRLDQGDSCHLMARVGSDEFGFLYSPIQGIEQVIQHSQTLINLLAEPFILESEKLYPTANVGIAIYPSDGEQAEDLLTHADTALRSAKAAGVGNYHFYSSEMTEQLRRRLALERDLRSALEREELELFYQPQIDYHTDGGDCMGAEVLLRWRHPQEGFISPGEFIPVAEMSGLIIPIGEWVLQKACQQNHLWQLGGLHGLRVAVNLSALQFQQPNLVELVATTLENTHHNPDLLELEITEGLLMNDVQSAIKILQSFRDLGVTVALDDFGTGYSSLSYLKRFPLNFLKIDQSFVRGIPQDSNDTAIVRSVIALAQSLQLDVIAEGVETAEQATFLHNLGCHKFQGYYFGRPMPALEFTRFWEARQAP